MLLGNGNSLSTHPEARLTLQEILEHPEVMLFAIQSSINPMAFSDLEGKEELEEKVQERTASLQKANLELQEEIRERENAQQALQQALFFL